VYDKSSSLPAQNYNLSFTAQKPDQSLSDLARVLLLQGWPERLDSGVHHDSRGRKLAQNLRGDGKRGRP